MVEKEIGEIERMGRSKQQKEDGMKSRKVEDGTGNVGRTREMWTTKSRNVEADGESLRPVEAARGTSAEGARR
jgi:DNA helicase TIP49 (TBP-interacting protein)